MLASFSEPTLVPIDIEITTEQEDIMQEYLMQCEGATKTNK